MTEKSDMRSTVATKKFKLAIERAASELARDLIVTKNQLATMSLEFRYIHVPSTADVGVKMVLAPTGDMINALDRVTSRQEPWKVSHSKKKRTR